MKKVFGYSRPGHFDFEIKSHAGLYYLFLNENKIAKCDEKKPLKTYIDGFVHGYETKRIKET